MGQVGVQPFSHVIKQKSKLVFKPVSLLYIFLIGMGCSIPPPPLPPLFPSASSLVFSSSWPSYVYPVFLACWQSSFPYILSLPFHQRTKQQREHVVRFFRWDQSIHSLASTLHNVSPNIFPKTDHPPIPDHPPVSIKVCLIY